MSIPISIFQKIKSKTLISFSKVLKIKKFRFKLDGIVYSGRYQTDRPGVLRYVASGAQRARNRLVEELVPGDGSLLSDARLTRDERCALHFGLSNTIWDHYEEAEEEFCGPGPSERLDGLNIPYRYTCVYADNKV